jgi:hypothetical protein
MEIHGPPSMSLRHRDRRCSNRINRGELVPKRVLRANIMKEKKEQVELTIRMWVTYSSSTFDHTNSSSSSHAFS